MEKLNRDLIIKLALELDLPSLTKLCQTSRRVNEIVCENNIFWQNKTYKEYPDLIGKFPKDTNYKRLYQDSINDRQVIQWIDKAFYHRVHDTYQKSRFDNFQYNMDLALHWAIQNENVILAKKALQLGATWDMASYHAGNPYSNKKFRITYLKMRELYFPEAPPI